MDYELCARIKKEADDMTSLFDIKGQTLTPLETFDVVSETVNYLTFAFMFSYDWAGLTKSALFTKGDDEYEVVLVNDAITADKHVNLSAGEWTLSVVGSTVVDAVVTRRITTTPYTFTVTQADAVDGEEFPPSIASQVYVNVNQATPQTFVSGIPKLAADRVIDHDNELADKKYVDDKVATVTAVDSVNGKTGAVVLTASEVGADASGAADAVAAAADLALGRHDASYHAHSEILSGKQDNVLSTTLTIAVADWNGGTTATVCAEYVSATRIVIVDPSDPSVECTAQGDEELTFSAPATPTAAVTVKVVIFP